MIQAYSLSTLLFFEYFIGNITLFFLWTRQWLSIIKNRQILFYATVQYNTSNEFWLISYDSSKFLQLFVKLSLRPWLPIHLGYVLWPFLYELLLTLNFVCSLKNRQWSIHINPQCRQFIRICHSFPEVCAHRDQRLEVTTAKQGALNGDRTQNR